MNDVTITIFHNADCGASRNTLALIYNSGIEPLIIEYLTTPPGCAKLVEAPEGHALRRVKAR